MRVYEITICRDFTPDAIQRMTNHATRFSSDIYFSLEQANIKLNVKSLLGMMMFPLRKGTRLTVLTQGADEKEAIDWVCEILEQQEA
jgi:phosphocarrier protein HPr